MYLKQSTPPSPLICIAFLCWILFVKNENLKCILFTCNLVIMRNLHFKINIYLNRFRYDTNEYGLFGKYKHIFFNCMLHHSSQRQSSSFAFGKKFCLLKLVSLMLIRFSRFPYRSRYKSNQNVYYNTNMENFWDS